MDQVHSIEKIYLRDHLKLRHFVTNSKNELYEDKDGNIYISADKQGIYRLSFLRLFLFLLMLREVVHYHFFLE